MLFRVFGDHQRDADICNHGNNTFTRLFSLLLLLLLLCVCHWALTFYSANNKSYKNQKYNLITLKLLSIGTFLYIVSEILVNKLTL